jgi:hypothetical protein
VSNKTGMAVLFAALVAVFVVFLRETYWAIVVDWVFDYLASYLGVGRAKMLATAAPFAVALIAAGVIVGTAYKIGLREKSFRAVLTVLYEENNPAYVRPVKGLYNQHGEFYSIGIKNKGHVTHGGFVGEGPRQSLHAINHRSGKSNPGRISPP